MENQVRELLREIAEDIPLQLEMPPTLRPRARRRVVANVGMTVVVIGALVLGSLVALRSITESPPRPAGPLPAPHAAGEVLNVVKQNLVTQDPGTGAIRTIVDYQAIAPIKGTPKGIVGAAWSPDHRWVAFRAGALWVADTIGGTPRQVAPDPGWDPWAWSPSRDQLAVVQGRDVMLIDAATGRETRIGNAVGPEDPDGVAVHALAWSPDGTRIVFDGGPNPAAGGGGGRWRNGGGGSVYSIDVESGKQTLLVRQPAGTGQIRDIDWSPEGAHLAITYTDAAYIASHKTELQPVAYNAKALYLANADGSGVRLLDRVIADRWPVFNPDGNTGAAWSPDGTRLAYTSLSAPRDWELQGWTVSVDGSFPTLVATRSCCMVDFGGPVWSPDGSEIAFATHHGSPVRGYHVTYSDTDIIGHPLVNADGAGDPSVVDDLTYRSWSGGQYFCYCYG